MTDLRKRDWCFTLNNYTTDEFEYLNSLMVNDGLVYMVVGKECGESGTKHLQGYIYFKSAKTMSAVKKYLKCDRLHLETTKGTPQQASDYCKKEGDFFLIGELPVGQGKRTDLENVKALLKDTGKMSEVVLQATSYQSVRMAETILKYHEKKRNWKPIVRWFYGPSGTGKTRTADEILGEGYYPCEEGKWFDGYDAHEKVLIDDLRSSFMSFNRFLRLIDRYAFRVECKGGSRQFLAKEIIITSPYPPEYIWSSNGEDKKQLLRRIDEIRKFIAEDENS